MTTLKELKESNNTDVPRGATHYHTMNPYALAKDKDKKNYMQRKFMGYGIESGEPRYQWHSWNERDKTWTPETGLRFTEKYKKINEESQSTSLPELKEEKEFKVGDKVKHTSSGKIGTINKVYDNKGSKSYSIHGFAGNDVDKKLIGTEFLAKHLSPVQEDSVDEGLLNKVTGAIVGASIALAGHNIATAKTDAPNKLADMKAKHELKVKQNLAKVKAPVAKKSL